MTAAYLYNQKTGEYDVASKKEQVLCLHLPADIIDFHLFTNGVCRDRLASWKIFQDIMTSKNLFYVDRDEAETNESFLQIIPYVILKRKGKVFAYQRTKKSGEKRLHGNWSIGVGGHINPVDNDAVDSRGAYYNAVHRELKEEVGAVPEKIELTALIFDPSNAVGRVHLGIVHVAEVANTIRPIEDTMGAHGFFTWEDLVQSLNLNATEYENWTKLLLSSKLDI